VAEQIPLVVMSMASGRSQKVDGAGVKVTDPGQPVELDSSIVYRSSDRVGMGGIIHYVELARPEGSLAES
jgi:hypothetical protein